MGTMVEYSNVMDLLEANMKESFSRKMERKLSKFAIQNISLYLILCYAVGFVIQSVNEPFLHNLTLEPYLILKGQVWRLFTWIICPPETSNIFFVLITLYFYYSIGTTIERVWGAYRYNLYLFGGMLFTVLGSFALYAVLTFGFGYLPVETYGIGEYVTTYYVNMSIFLAYAATFPDMQVLLMFILPIRVKVLGIIYFALLLLTCMMGGIIYWFIIGSSLLNFFVFFFFSINKRKITPKQAKQRMVYRSQVKKQAAVTRHKCAICGRTEESNPELAFRFCSKCNGNYEYCEEHLFTHEHVK